jgi:hypothetical protein
MRGKLVSDRMDALGDDRYCRDGIGCIGLIGNGWRCYYIGNNACQDNRHEGYCFHVFGDVHVGSFGWVSWYDCTLQRRRTYLQWNAMNCAI